MRRSGNMQNEIADAEHGYTNGVAGKKVIVLDASGNQVTDFGTRFGTNHIDEADASTTYIGKEDSEGTWLIQKISVSGTVTAYTFATITNNESVTSYNDAWTDRATLIYGTYSSAF